MSADVAFRAGGDAWLLEMEDDEVFARLRANTYTGWPTGSPEFVAQLEARLGRRLTRLPAGRKKKEGVIR